MCKRSYHLFFAPDMLILQHRIKRRKDFYAFLFWSACEWFFSIPVLKIDQHPSVANPPKYSFASRKIFAVVIIFEAKFV